MSDLDVELELISASLMPSEELKEHAGTTRIITIANAESQRALCIQVRKHYPACDAVTIELKGNDIGRDVAMEENQKIAEDQVANWARDEYPLYQLLTGHLLPLLAPPVKEEAVPSEYKKPSTPPIPHHTLLTSHHLLSNTKRKNLLSLASQLSLTGFSKVGHPGVYYAIGEREDLEEWTREVKSWNWLALRVRVGIEPVLGEAVQLFLPSSRYFMGGCTPAPRLAVPSVTPLDAIDAVFKLDNLGTAIRDLYKKVAEPTSSNGPDKVWERWTELDKESLDWRTLKVEPPIFPMRGKVVPFVATYEYAVQLVASFTPLPGVAHGEKPAQPMLLDDFEEMDDINPYSSAVLDEFDEVMFEELSATTRTSSKPSGHGEPRRVPSSGFVSSRSREPISVWKHMSTGPYSSFSPIFEPSSVSMSDYFPSNPPSVRNQDSFWQFGGSELRPQHPTQNASFQREPHEYWGNFEADDKQINDFEAFSYEPTFSDFGTAPLRQDKCPTSQPTLPVSRFPKP
ncbi:hypothetical protein CspeluHIS016_0105610 [Cutaneotrichosporon spelunceum]|uniref:Uncharacterized protein n=1 Tax=Cutaneotrichosporon spelunceum TaxID=1672016 RepID=A0AAD3Y7Z9_9TREE|nr:hypothetical protein CspeluHIS016_0105610 [Cutaneotrichosporon spelunceum]